MKLKDLIFLKFTEIKVLCLGTSLALLLLMLRIKYTQNFHFIFLGWNLFLALIPYLMSLFLYLKPGILLRPWLRICYTFVWLLFLPNAPYILTDFIHLRLSTGPLLFLDFSLIALFATTGFLSGLFAMRTMINFYQALYKPKSMLWITISCCFLCGFGVYLGRFIRLNSWDVFTHPWATTKTIFTSMAHPMALLLTATIGTIYLLCLFYQSATAKKGDTKI